VVKDVVLTGPHSMGDGEEVFNHCHLPDFDSSSRVELTEVLLLNMAPLQAELAKEKVFPPNLLLGYCNGDWVSRGLEGEYLVG